MTGVSEILELIFFIMMMTNDLEHQIEAENLTATRICLVLAFIGSNVIQYNVAFGQQNIRLHWSMVDLLGCLTQLAIAAGMCGSTPPWRPRPKTTPPVRLWRPWRATSCTLTA